MCAGATLNARVNRVVFGADEPRTGAAGSLVDVLRDRRALHQVEVVRGVLADEAAAQLSEFFKERRDVSE
jgi:tRNA(adenine34) deaminase